MFQRLTRSEYAWIVNLVSKQLADGAKIEKIINQITIDRIKMAKEKFEFSKKILDALESTEITQKIIVTLNYYAYIAQNNSANSTNSILYLAWIGVPSELMRTKYGSLI